MTMAKAQSSTARKPNTEFVDDRGRVRFPGSLIKSTFGFDWNVVKDWVRHGNLTKPERLKIDGPPGRQLFFVKDELVARSDARNAARVRKAAGDIVAADPHWADRRQAQGEYGVGSELLTMYSPSLLKPGQRKHPTKSRPELGRPFNVKIRERTGFGGNGATISEQVWSRADLAKVQAARDAKKLPVGMMKVTDAENEFGISDSAIINAIIRRELPGRKYYGVKSNAAAGFFWIVSAKKVEQWAASFDDREVGTREFDLAGEKYYPLLESAKMSGIPWGRLIDYRDVPCRGWGGIIIRSTEMKVRLRHNRWGANIRVYRGQDLLAAKRFREGWKDSPVSGLSGRKRPGRPTLTLEGCDRRLQVLSEWKQAAGRCTLKEFCDRKGLKVATLRNWQSWAIMRSAK
jgi:hypothetical protein